MAAFADDADPPVLRQGEDPGDVAPSAADGEPTADVAGDEAYQRRVRDVVGRRGYDEGEDETQEEDEEH